MNNQLQELLELKDLIYSLEKKINDISNKLEQIVADESDILEEFLKKLRKLDEIDNIKEELKVIKEKLDKKKIIF